MIITIEVKHAVGSTVYLKTDVEQVARMVVGYSIYGDGNTAYLLACGTITSTHYEFEISAEKNIVMA